MNIELLCGQEQNVPDEQTVSCNYYYTNHRKSTSFPSVESINTGKPRKVAVNNTTL